MRTAFAHSLFFAGRPTSRVTSCGRCGDSFTGLAADGREWLAGHYADEHPPLGTTSRRPDLTERPERRPARVLRESLSA